MKFKYLLVVYFLSTILSCPLFAFTLQSQTNTSRQNLILCYDQPAKDWNEALPIGNGRLGAMVFGGTNRSYSIGILFPDLSNPFFSEWYHVVEQISGSKGYLNYICTTDPYGESELKRIDDLLVRSIDGILYFSYQKNAEVLNKLNSISKYTPVVCCDGMMIGEDHSYVCADGQKGTYETTRFLIESGRKRIAYIKGTDAYQVGLNRFEGFKQAIVDSGLNVDESLVFSGDFKMADGFDAARFFMNQAVQPDAIMAATDFMAIGALNYLNDYGISVPETIAVVGFDNLLRSAETNPSLTTIELPLEQIASNAIDALIHQMENDKTIIQQVYDGKLIVRQSS